MMMRTFRACALAIGACVVSVAAGYAATPSSTIKGWQDSAPEALEVTVVSVREQKQVQPVAREPNCTTTRYTFTVTAKVDVVRRSASGMQPGRTVTFRHDAIRTAPCALPDGNFGDILNEGDHAEAYLRPAGTP